MSAARISIPLGYFEEMASIYFAYKDGRLVWSKGAAVPPTDPSTGDAEPADTNQPSLFPGADEPPEIIEEQPTIIEYGVPPGYIASGVNRRKDAPQVRDAAEGR